MCVAFSPDDKLIAVGSFDGAVCLYDAATGNTRLEFNISTTARVLPVTSLRFHPTAPVLLLTASDGTVEKRDLRTGEAIYQFKEEHVEVYCCDYRKDGAMFATGAVDGAVRVFDDSNGKLLHRFATVGEHTVNKPAARLYSVVFAPDDVNMLYCAGWGNAVHVFDLRQPEKEVRNIFGPYLVGDALDVRSGVAITASHRLDNRLSMIDLQTSATRELPWPSSYNFTPTCAKMSPDATGEFLAVGGSGGHGLDSAAFVMERRTGRCVLDTLIEGGVNTVAFSTGSGQKDGSSALRVAFGDGHGAVHVFEKPAPKRTN